MQKKNPVIKNYILSTEKRILQENSPYLIKDNFSIDNSKYHLLLKQNMDSFFLFLSRK